MNGEIMLGFQLKKIQKKIKIKSLIVPYKAIGII